MAQGMATGALVALGLALAAMTAGSPTMLALAARWLP